MVMDSDDAGRISTEIDQRLKIARSVPISAPAFMSTRIAAAYRETPTVKRWAWRAAVPSLVAASLAVFLMVRAPIFEATTGKGAMFVIHSEGKDDLRQVASVQVVLPPGVQFYSEDMPQLANIGALTLPWDPAQAQTGLPVVIRSEQDGLKRIKVRYLDSNQQPLLENTLRVRFRREKAI